MDVPLRWVMLIMGEQYGDGRYMGGLVPLTHFAVNWKLLLMIKSIFKNGYNYIGNTLFC